LVRKIPRKRLALWSSTRQQKELTWTRRPAPTKHFAWGDRLSCGCKYSFRGTLLWFRSEHGLVTVYSARLTRSETNYNRL